VAVEPLARGPDGGSDPALWRYAWPRAFRSEVEAAAAGPGLDPALVYAVMREESGFRPDAVSVVGARGLVQIMPDTGLQLARRRGESGLDPAQLFVPARNLSLGAQYLAELLARFQGRTSAAVAAYNAGPAAVERWLREEGGLDDDEWVEAIPYEQTRRYVKRVLRSLHAYRALYPPDAADADGGRAAG